MTHGPTPADAIIGVARATDLLLATVDRMSEADFAAPSLLPDWSRAHVLAHLALHAKSMAACLTTLGQDDPLPMYPSDMRRDRDIARLAAEPPARIADRLAIGSSMLARHFGGGPTPEEALEAVGEAGVAATAVRDARAARSGVRAPNQMEPRGDVIPVFSDAAATARETIAAWDATGSFERTPGGRLIPASQAPIGRWREIEIHHADLGLGYGPAEWSREFADYLLSLMIFDRSSNTNLTLTVRRYDGSPERTLTVGAGGPSVSGSAAELAWWLIGRGSGDGLTGDLPELGPWVRRT